MGHPVLRAKGQPVPPGDIKSARIQRLIDDMFETMGEYSGIGLAAPQVHESLRLFVAGVREAPVTTPMGEDEDMPFMTVINPEIVPLGEETTLGWEGCLSIPDIRGKVPRAASIRLRAYDRQARRIELVASGLPARVIQHETDHLDGVLFFDRMTSFETLAFMDEFRRYFAKDEDDEDDDNRGRSRSVSTIGHAFSEAEASAIAPYFTNLDRTVFALVNLPETVKGALFARYSRSPKSLRRLFLDEFHPQVALAPSVIGAGAGVGLERADRLFQRVFNEYGDDSVAQLGGVHLAVEDASNILTKVLERGRLMAYLEQSTRYIPYTERRGESWRYYVPPELDGHPLGQRYVETMNATFEIYAKWIDPMRAWFERRYPKSATDSDAVYRSAIRAKALDTLRGLLPASTQSNVGLFGTGQAYEALLLRMRAHPLVEVRQTADQILAELRQVIPAFLTRVDQTERGVRWSQYLADTRARMEEVAVRIGLSAAYSRACR